MKTYKKRLLALLLITQFCACSGENPGIQQAELTLKTPSPITHYVLNNSYFYNANEFAMADSPQVRESRRFGQESASFFSYARDIRISRISWHGHVENNESLNDGKATFIVRFYADGNTSLAPLRLPAQTPLSEFLIAAEARLLGPGKTGYWYQFVYSDYAMFNQSAGNYWVSLMDAETDALDFSWVVAPVRHFDVLDNFASVRDLAGNWTVAREENYQHAMSVKLEGGPPVEMTANTR